MKIKQVIKPVKNSDRFHDETSVEITLVSINAPLGLGNNYSLEHLVDAIKEALTPTDFIELYEAVCDFVKISYKTSYGRGIEFLNYFDFTCYFKDIYDNIEYSNMHNQYYYV